ncbi:MAG: arsenosugar biosynthesis radical SAM protein ArsS [Verrucomicrobiota bacterium]|nr:arsenosugar biosynthesis radical SAM protein ArsS [Verrucomicrobiota bacterium]
MNSFEQRLAKEGLVLQRGEFEILQLNLGRKCNQACRHCHVDAAPWRTEMMGMEVAAKIIEWIKRWNPSLVDITGGAPELNEAFKPLLEAARKNGARVIDRCNLTILEEPGFEAFHHYLAENEVEIVASLPCYSPENVTKQRGNGVFERSIRAIKKLNQVGYGNRLPLDLVYNPLGAKLPPPQAELEADYREHLGREYGIIFNRLLTITNQPIARFAEDLKKSGQFEAYHQLLMDAFNPATIPGLMCRNTLSVDFNGAIYDCDFNQMLGLQIRNGKSLYLWDVTPEILSHYPVRTGSHCFACTAGAGSSCGGALI